MLQALLEAFPHSYLPSCLCFCVGCWEPRLYPRTIITSALSLKVFQAKLLSIVELWIPLIVHVYLRCIIQSGTWLLQEITSTTAHRPLICLEGWYSVLGLRLIVASLILMHALWASGSLGLLLLCGPERAELSKTTLEFLMMGVYLGVSDSLYIAERQSLKEENRASVWSGFES